VWEAPLPVNMENTWQFTRPESNTYAQNFSMSINLRTMCNTLFLVLFCSFQSPLIAFLRNINLFSRNWLMCPSNKWCWHTTPAYYASYYDLTQAYNSLGRLTHWYQKLLSRRKERGRRTKVSPLCMCCIVWSVESQKAQVQNVKNQMQLCTCLKADFVTTFLKTLLGFNTGVKLLP